MDNITALQAFLDDIDCLRPITEHIAKINIFHVLGIENTEIRHSFMLAWLMDPVSNHGLDDCILSGILRYADPGAPQDCTGFTVERELNNIDLMAVSNADRYVLCIENKIYSGEHDNQLNRYRELVEGTYPGYRKALIYLTPAGKPSSDPGNWISMSYRSILDIITEAIGSHHLSPEADLLIRNYMEVIGRYDRKDSGIRKACEEIYSRHRHALDLVFTKDPDHPQEEDGPDSSDPEEKRLCHELYRKYRKELKMIRPCRPRKGGASIADIIISWATEKSNEERIRLDPENTQETTIRFTTEAMSSLLPDVPGGSSAWGTPNFYFYEIRNEALDKNDPNSSRSIRIQLSVNFGDVPEYLRGICDRINEFSPAPGKGKHYRLNYDTKPVIITVNDDKEKITALLDEFLDQTERFEQDLIAFLSR